MQHSIDHRKPAGEWRGNAGLVAASHFGVGFSVAALGFTYSIGPFVRPLTQEFGWSRQDIFLAQTMMTLVIVLMSPVIGWVADRHGVRRMVIASQALFGLAFVAIGLGTHSLATFYALYLLMAVVGGGTIGIGFARLISQRFEAQRGLALGIANAGTGLCGFLVPIYATWAIGEFGWRGGYAALAALPLLVALPMSLLFLHDRPRTLSAVGAEAASVPAASGLGAEPGVTFREALSDRRFWAMAVGLFACSGMMTAFIASIVPLLQEAGLPDARAALAASAFGIAVVTGRIAVGWLIDRHFAPLVGALLLIPAGLAVLAFNLPGLPFVAAFAAVFLIGLAAGAEVDLMAYLTSRYFGLREYGRIFAAQYMAFALGPGVMVPLVGRARDLSGDYGTALAAISAGIALFGVLLLTLGPYPRLGTPPAADPQ
ncbi:MAG: MFS transporter [Gammaproteobacteria bacterium]|nr:MFS transporter [Gammaproteobacteria bacterium]